MKTQNILLEQLGFTLIETLMAMAIFTIGILGLFGMQTAAIKENLAANNITTGTTWASEQVEKLIGLRYDHTKLLDDEGGFDKDFDKNNNGGKGADTLNGNSGDGCNGLNDRVYNPGTPSSSDGFISEDSTKLTPLIPPIYKIYWNIAKDCTLINISEATREDQDARTKHLRIIVTRDNGNGPEEVVAVTSYITRNNL
jgi:prepilin-type N-terminal cleavage/methylation domain-containing protein